MAWFIIDYEVSILGKDMIVVDSPDKETAKEVAIRLIENENKIIQGQVNIISVKEKSTEYNLLSLSISNNLILSHHNLSFYYCDNRPSLKF